VLQLSVYDGPQLFQTLVAANVLMREIANMVNASLLVLICIIYRSFSVNLVHLKLNPFVDLNNRLSPFCSMKRNEADRLPKRSSCDSNIRKLPAFFHRLLTAPSCSKNRWKMTHSIDRFFHSNASPFTLFGFWLTRWFPGDYRQPYGTPSSHFPRGTRGADCRRNGNHPIRLLPAIIHHWNSR
jgi:hypothetical protein